MKEQFQLVSQIKALPPAGQRELFYSAIEKRHARALLTILEGADIQKEDLAKGLYAAATHNMLNICRILISDPETDVNWRNEENFNFTPAIRAAENGYGEFVNMLLNHEDFDPNIATAQDAIAATTIMTTVFGYMPKDSIKEPEEGWKRRLLNDPRIDWDAHNKLIEERKSLSRQHKEVLKTGVDSEAERKKLEAQLSPIREALGLSAPDLTKG